MAKIDGVSRTQADITLTAPTYATLSRRQILTQAGSVAGAAAIASAALATSAEAGGTAELATMASVDFAAIDLGSQAQFQKRLDDFCIAARFCHSVLTKDKAALLQTASDSPEEDMETILGLHSILDGGEVQAQSLVEFFEAATSRVLCVAATLAKKGGAA